MATEVTMPKLGLTMTEGVVARWLVEDGTPVEKGTPIFEIETDKAVVQAESPATGVLRIVAEKGSSVPVASLVAYLLSPGEELPGVGAPASIEEGRQRVLASPAAKRRARELGIDLAVVSGSGEGGRITERDVDDYAARSTAARPPEFRVTPTAQRMAEEAKVDLGELAALRPGKRITKEDVGEAIAAAATALASGTTSPQTSTVVPIAGVRAVIAQRMAQSARTVARVTLITEVDATALVELRSRLNDELEPVLGFPVSYDALLVRAAALSLRACPYMNATQFGDEIRLLEQVNMGVAVDTQRGLLVPVVRNADQKGIGQIERELHSLVERAIAGESSPDELTGGSFTISNLGMFGVDAFTPIINPPELAILGVGRIVRKPAEHEGQIALRWRMALGLSFDHRLVDGAPAARFLRQVGERVESPLLLLL